MFKYLKGSVFYSLLVYSSLSTAAGPLVLEGPKDNTPVTYQNPNITLNIENGRLGALSNAQADALVQQAFDLWNNVGTATINLNADETQINLDVNITNFDDYLPNVSGTVLNGNDNLNPVIYDDNGEIIDAFFGVGQSKSTIGFATSIYTIGSRYFNEGYAVINGKDLNLSTTIFKLLITHEIGHFFGLDHSQADISNQETGSQFCKTSIRSKYPVMYPFACREIDSLHEDDVSSISALYPAATVSANFGVLNGRLTDKSGRALRGANMWVENTTTGEIYSVISDYLKQGSGFYELLLPAGNYTLHANSINTEFNGGSAIGPYSASADDISFKCPHPIAAADYEGNTPGNIEVITVSTDQTRVINFSLSGVDIDICPAPPTEAPLDVDEKSSGAISVTSLSMLILLLIARRRACKNKLPRSKLTGY